MMLKLRSNCNGVQGISLIQKFRHFILYSTSTSSNPGFVNYLVESLGFSSKQALSTSTKLAHNRQNRGTKNVTDFNFLENADSVITYLKQIGVEQSNIRSVICSVPEILLSKVDKTLKPKTEFFMELGFSGSDFIDLVKKNRLVLFLGLNTSIVPIFQSLKEIMGSDYEVFLLMKKSHRLRLNSVPKTLMPNVALLREYGIPIESIRKRIQHQPNPFFRNADVFQDVLNRVEKTLRIPRDSSNFLSGVHLVASVKPETIESKIQTFKSFGWTESDIVVLCRSKPMCLALSEATIKKKLEFFINKLCFKPSYLASRFFLLTCSLEKRIVPRHKALVVLRKKGLIKENISLEKCTHLKDYEFVEKFVLPFKEVHEVYSKHAGISLEKLSECNKT